MSIAILTNVVTSLGYGSIMARQYVKEDARQKQDETFISHQIIQAMTAMTIASEVFQLGWTMARAFSFKAIAVTSIICIFALGDPRTSCELVYKIARIVERNISVLSNITYVTSVVALAYFGNLSLSLPGLTLYSVVLLSNKGLLPRKVQDVFREFMKPLYHVTLLVFGDVMTKFMAVLDLLRRYHTYCVAHLHEPFLE